MRLHFVSIPVQHSEPAERELDHFLATHRILGIERQLIADGPRSVWALCITYVEASSNGGVDPEAGGKKGRVDYRELLSDEDFVVFARLRDLRKNLAERGGVPPYAIFTNEQLAEMARRRTRSNADLGRIDGIGPSRIDKYGKLFLDLLASATTPEAGPAEDT
jgi:superfamily II DNA helicase RecQ